MYGDRVSLVARCPAPGCEAMADVDVRLSALAPERPVEAPEVLTVTLPEGRAEVREPTGEDDALLADVAGLTGGAGLAPVVSAGGGGWTGADAFGLVGDAGALAVRGGVGTRGRFDRSGPGDAGSLSEVLRVAGVGVGSVRAAGRELRGGAARLETEVHVLAFHYHWSEADILALPRVAGGATWSCFATSWKAVRWWMAGADEEDAHAMAPPPVQGQVGLTRREMERELAWMLRSVPDDPKEFIKLLTQTVVALMDKNNEAIARSLAQREPPGARGNG